MSKNFSGNLKARLALAWTILATCLFFFLAWHTKTLPDPNGLITFTIATFAISAIVSLSYYITTWHDTTVESVSPVPIIRVYTHNSVTAAVLDSDYREWWRYEAEYHRNLGTRRIIPAPVFTAFFTDDPVRHGQLGSLLTGTMEEYRKLVEGCHIEFCELYIPRLAYQGMQFSPISLIQAYRLFYGKLPGKPALFLR